MKSILRAVYADLRCADNGGTPSTVYAMEETPKLIDSVNNREVSEMNEMLDNVKHFTPEIVSK